MMKCLKFPVRWWYRPSISMANKVARSIGATLCTCMVRELDKVVSNRNHADWVSELWCPSLPECEAFQRCVTAQIHISSLGTEAEYG